MGSLFKIASGIVLGLLAPYLSAENLWMELTSMPEGRSGMVAFIANESEPAYYGGSSWNEGEKRIHASGYVLRDNQWQPLESLQSPIAYAAIASDQGRLFAAGGTNGSALRTSLLSLNSNNGNTPIEIDSPQPRVYAGAALIDGAFFLVGGTTAISPLNPCSSLRRFDQGNWSEISHLPESALINPAVCSWLGDIFVFGGGMAKADGLQNTDSVFSFDPKDQTWTREAELPAPTRGAVALPIPKIGILIIGGYFETPAFASQTLLFIPERNEFVSLGDLPIGLLLPAVVATEKWIYVFGGEDAPKHRSNRVYRADLSRLSTNRNE